MNNIRLHKAPHCAALMIMAMCSSFQAMAEEDPMYKEPFYVNEATIYLQPEPDDSKALGVTTVSEGLWAREFPDGYQFYDLQGIKFTDSRWNLPGHNARPRMTRWGMIAKKVGADRDAPYILVKPNGSEVALPANWSYATPFVDSLAIVGIRDGYRMSYRYITPDLKIAFPNLSPIPQYFEGENNPTPPLSEGLRAYCVEDGAWRLWGFIDANGKVVIEPQFTDARSFHCGLAWVKDKQGDRYFINREGKKAFEPQFSDASDYDAGLCSTRGAQFYLTDYYDIHGNKVQTLKNGSPFHNGYAYYFVHDESTNKDFVHRIDKTFTDCGAVGNVTTAYYNPPEYDAIDVAHFNPWMVEGAACNGQYFYDYTVGLFSKEGYAPATMVTNDGKTIYKGFIDTGGHLKIVYSKQTK